MRKPHILFAACFTSLLGWAIPVSAQVQWMSWEQAMERMEQEPRKLLVDIYTDWCGWCKRMDATTFSQPLLAEYINEHFYPVKLNAESRDPLTWNGKTFDFVRAGRNGYHALAAELTRGRLSFPTIVFLNEKLEVIQPLPGYKEPAVFEQIVTYFGEDAYLRVPWEVYQRQYVPLAQKKE